MIRAIIFDCFGVVFLDRFAEKYQQFGGDLEKDHDFIHQYFFEVSKGIIGDNDTTIADKLGITKEQWDKSNGDAGGFNNELLSYIKELRKTYKIGMLSNVGNKGLAHYMNYRVLEEYFDVVVESAKIGFAKPEARAYEVAAEKLGVRLDECVFTDDRPPYIEGASHVGMKTILFKDAEQFKKELEALLTLVKRQNS